MGELGITISDLDKCPECNHTVPMIFEDGKLGWYIVCGFRNKCNHRTKHNTELLDAATEWGLV